MALTRKFLAALGIEADKVDEIINAHTETVNGLKEAAEKYREDAEKLKDVQKELTDLKEANKDYETLKKEFEDYKTEIQTKEIRSAKEKAYREAMKDANLNEKGIEKAVKYANWDNVELDESGKLKNAKELIKAGREEWAEYVVTSGTKGADTPTPPANAGGGKLTREDIYKTDDKGRFVMDAQARQKALAELMEFE